MKKILSFISFTVVALGFSIYQSCKHPAMHCLLLNNVQVVPFNDNTAAPMQPMDSVLAQKLNLHINLNTTELNCMKANGFSFINSAYAHDPVTNFVYYDSLKSITISCLQDFDSTHPAGFPLNDYFAVPAFFGNTEFAKLYSYSLHALPDSEMYYEFRVSVETYGAAVYDTILPPVKILL